MAIIPPKNQLAICFAHVAYQLHERFAALDTGIVSFAVRDPETLASRVGEADVLVISGLWHNGLLDRATAVPEEGDFGRILAASSGPAELVDETAPKQLDRWQAQVLGRVLQRAPVGLFAPGLTEEQTRRAHLEPVRDFGKALERALAARGPSARVCVLPFGPLTVADPG